MSDVQNSQYVNNEAKDLIENLMFEGSRFSENDLLWKYFTNIWISYFVRPPSDLTFLLYPGVQSQSWSFIVFLVSIIIIFFSFETSYSMIRLIHSNRKQSSYTLTKWLSF